MKEWVKNYKLLLGGSVDASVNAALLVAARARMAMNWQKSLALEIARNATSAMAKAFISLGYYLSASVIVTIMMMAVVLVVTAAGLVAFWTHVFDAS